MPDYEVQLSTEHPFLRTPFLCVDLFEQDLSSSPERELAGRFRAAPDGPFPAFPDGIAAFNEACQQEEVPQNGTHKRKEPIVGAFDNDEVRQEGTHVQSRVHLGGCLLAPVLRPAHAEGGQLNGGGIDGADGPLPEPVRESGIVPAGGQELGIGLRKQLIDLPEQFLGHVRAAGLVGVREAIAA